MPARKHIDWLGLQNTILDTYTLIKKVHTCEKSDTKRDCLVLGYDGCKHIGVHPTHTHIRHMPTHPQSLRKKLALCVCVTPPILSTGHMASVVCPL